MDLFTEFESRRSQAALRRSIEATDTGTTVLRQQLQLAILAIESLTEVLQRRFGVTREEILATMEEVDLLDGKRDGRLAVGVVSCPQCDRPNSRQASQCVYCGFDPLPMRRMSKLRDAADSSITSNEESLTIESSES